MSTFKGKIGDIISDCSRKIISGGWKFIPAEVLDKIMDEIDKEHRILRPALRWFAGEMETDLRKNDSKGGWLDDELGYYREKALKHLKVLKDIDSIKFITITSKKKAIAHCIKSANYSMMLAHNMMREIARSGEEEEEAISKCQG